MSPLKIHLSLWFAAAMLVLGAPHAVTAQGLIKGSTATFEEPIEIPGHVLPAGTYTFVEQGKSIVQVWDRDQTKLYATLLTNAAEQPQFKERKEFEFEKRLPDSPPELKVWFLDSGLIGHEFIYSK